jgi:hypothetical protein
MAFDTDEVTVFQIHSALASKAPQGRHSQMWSRRFQSRRRSGCSFSHAQRRGCPWRRVLHQAEWVGKDLQAGGSRGPKPPFARSDHRGKGGCRHRSHRLHLAISTRPTARRSRKKTSGARAHRHAGSVISCSSRQTPGPGLPSTLVSPQLRF